MATLNLNKILDPAARVNVSLKRSTRITLERYLRYVNASSDAPYGSSEIVDMVLNAWVGQDSDYAAFAKGLKEFELKEIERKAIAQEGDETTAVKKPKAPPKAASAPSVTAPPASAPAAASAYGSATTY